MKQKNWVKTLFSIYRCNTKLASAIDKFVQIKAHKPLYANLLNISSCSTLRLSDEIIALNNKKITLINMKYITEHILKSIKKVYARLLIMRYIENKKFLEISQILQISSRTTLRWHSNALGQGACILKKLNIDHQKMLNIINNEKWILDIFNKLEKQDESKRHALITEMQIIKIANKDYQCLTR